MAETITAIAAVKAYFGTKDKPVTFTEMKELGGEAIRELAPLCAQALGKELTA